jgi:hypothetical protein
MYYRKACEGYNFEISRCFYVIAWDEKKTVQIEKKTIRDLNFIHQYIWRI